MAALFSNEISLSLDAGVLKYYDPVSQRYECKVCPKIGCGDIHHHLASPPHKNNALWEAVHTAAPSSNLLEMLSETIQKAKIHDEIEAVNKKMFSYQCKICPGKKPFNGLAPLESHLQGAEHVKNRGQVSLTRHSTASNHNVPANQRQFNRPSPIRDEFPPLNHSQDKRISPMSPVNREWQTRNSRGPDSPNWRQDGGASQHSPQYSSPPKSTFTLPQQSSNDVPQNSVLAYRYQDHLPQEAADTLSSGVVVEYGATDGYSSYFCNACSVPMTGIKPLRQHLESIKHKKKVSGPMMDFPTPSLLSESAREALNSGIVEERGGSYFCRICSIPLTGPAPLSQHSESEKHRRKVDLQESMASRPPVPLVPKPNPLVLDSRRLPLQDSGTYQPQPVGEIDGRPYFPWNVKSITRTPQFKEDIYVNRSIPRGLAVIFNYHFTGENQRHGARRDSQNLQILFTRMGYYVNLFENCTKVQTLAELKNTQTNPQLGKYDSFVCVILSHGKNDSSFYTMGSETEELDIDDIRYHFTDIACPYLKGKPKIFLTNFCRGSIKEKVQDFEYDFVPSENSAAPQDMLTLYASIKNFSATRDEVKGTIFVQAICKVFAEHAHDTEIMNLYRRVCKEMQAMRGTTPEQQSYNFKKDYYFYPINIENYDCDE